MNEFIKILKDRRSVRNFSDKPIEKSVLEEIVDCARLSPSAHNKQPWKFVVVTDKEKLSKLSETPHGTFIKDAGACILVCGDKNVDRYVEDGCLAAENILLSAKSLGIGSCYVAAIGKDNGWVKELLDIPNDYEIVCFLALGHFDENPDSPRKKPLEDVVSWEKF
jgi:nitroreductase